MRLLTPDGELVKVRDRWPLAELDWPRQISQGSNGVRLTTSATGTARYATYKRLYKENPWVNAAIRTTAWGLSRSALGVFERISDEDIIRYRHDVPSGAGRPSAGRELARKLNTAPNRMGPQRRMRATATEYLIFGNALWVGVQDGALTYVPWRKVRVHEGDHVPILTYEVVGTKDSRFFAPEDVIHFSAGDDPDSPLGVPPMEALQHTLALHEALARHLTSFFQNAARPSGNFKLQPGAKPEAIKTMQELIRELYTSPENAGKVLVTTADFQPLTAQHDHSQIVELIKLSREEIAGVFRIPPPVLGILDRAIQSNVRELREQFIRDVVGAWAPAFEDDIQAQLIDPNPSLRYHYVQFDLDEHLRPDLEAMGKAFKDLETTMTTNERRRKVGLPKLEYPEADTVAVTPGGAYLGIAPPLKPDEPADEPADDDESEETE